MRNALIALAILIASCGTPSPSDGAADTTQPPSEAPDGSWVFTEGTAGGAAVPLVDGYRITLNINGTQIGGTAACNSYGGTNRGDSSAFAIDELAHTEMACEPAVMASETAFLNGLRGVTSLIRAGDRLELSGDGVSFSFELNPPIPTADLLDTVWILDTLVDGEAASSVAGEPATLELRADGTLRGSTGCRSLSGVYVLTGDEVLFTEFSADGECSPDLQSQDDHVVSVLGDGFTVQIDGARLTVTSAGSAGLVYREG